MAVSSVITRIMDEARVNLPGASDGTMRMLMFNVCKEFTQRSNAWRDSIEFTACHDCSEYDIATTENAVINRLIWVEGKRPNPPQIGSAYPGVLAMAGAATVKLIIGARPSGNECWHAHVSLNVADPTTRDGLPYLPDWLAEKYSRPLTSGVIYRAASQPSKPYTNEKVAAVHAREFSDGMNRAKVEALHGHTFRGQNWTYPQQFRARTQRTYTIPRGQ